MNLNFAKTKCLSRLFLTVAALLAVLSSWAQESLIDVSGKVVDERNRPLVGVTVVEKDGVRGTTSGVGGDFAFKADPRSTLSVSYMGYLPQEFPAGQVKQLTIVMKESAREIDDVVVVGYAVQKKVNLTGAVATVDMDEVLDGRPVTNLSAGLAGLSAGLYVNQNSGRPNADGATLLVRGRGTLNNASPLVIIDGVEGDLGDVNPQDVESVSVLKDASSSSIYGSRAANGVVLVTTRRGREGRFQLSYNGYVSFAKPSNLLETVSDYADYMEYYNEALANTDKAAKQQYSDAMIRLWRENKNDPAHYPNTDWTKEIFTTGVSHNHDVSFSAGSQRMSLFGSLGYLDNPGIVENSAYKRYSARVNIDARVTKWLTLGMNVSGRTSTADIGSKYMGGLFSAVGTPGIVYRSADGRYGGIENPEENAQVHSPLYIVNNRVGDITGHRLNSRFTARADILKNLSVEGSLNYGYANTLEEETPRYDDLWSFRNNTIVYARSGKTYVRNRNTANKRLLMDAIVRYNTDLTGRLKLNVMAGASQEKFNTRWFEATRYDLLEDRLTVIDGATGDSETGGNAADWVMRSFFGRINLGFDDKYLFEANLRADGSSRFRAGGSRWGVFPSFSVGWRISEERFLKKTDWIDQLKIRASWGALGNNSVGNYEYQSVYDADNYILNNTLVPGLAQLAISNAAITWETTYVTNIGIDFGFFRSRLNGTVDLFDKDTRNILIDLPAPLLVGNAAVPTQNAARVNNRGVELTLRWQDKVGDFSYFIGGNLSWVKNEVTRYKGDEPTIRGANMIREGYPINVQYVLSVDRIVQTDDDLLLVKEMIKNAPKDPATGQAKNPFAAYGTPTYGDFLYKDLNGDGLIDENDRYAVGHGNTPQLLYGIQLGGAWKGIDFSALIQGVEGMKTLWNDRFYQGYIDYGAVVNTRIAEGAWRPGRTDASYPRLLTGTNKMNNVASDFWVEDKSYMRLKNVQIGYTLPQKITSKAGISRLRVYAAGENLWTLTDYKGIDPEVGGTTYPTLKQFMLGINLTF